MLEHTPVVLVVEDEGAVRQLLKVALPQFGLRVLEAASGLEAVEAYEVHQGSIDVVLLDVRMPGVDGPDTLDALRQLNPRVRAVFMSADPGQYSREDLLNRGARHVLAKPFDSIPALAGLLRQVACAA